MSRIELQKFLWTAFILASLVLAAPGLAQGPFFLAYANEKSAPTDPQNCTLTVDPSLFQGGNSLNQPVLPTLSVPVGGTVFADLCFFVWPEGVATGTACLDGGGTDSCAERIRFTSNGGITVDAFDVAVPQPAYPDYDARVSPSSLVVMGGNPIDGQLSSGATGVHLGTVTLTGTAAFGVFELQDGAYVNAKMERILIPNMVLATTIDSCGDSIEDVGEECDDGNDVNGDGCTPSCRIEEGFSVLGVAGIGGLTVTMEIEGVPLFIDLSSLPNVASSDVAQALVTTINTDGALTVVAAQVDDPIQKALNDGSKVTLGGTITGFPVPVNTENGTIIFVPEPGLLLGVGSGIAALFTLQRMRTRGGRRRKA